MIKFFKIIFISFLCITLFPNSFFAQASNSFKGTYYNKEFDIYIVLDFYKSKLLVPGQSVLGEVSGYLGDNRDSRKWIFLDAMPVDKLSYKADVINDYGSEDLIASFVNDTDSTIVLKQLEGSAIKIARNSKWQRLPKQITFVRKK
jgi:hypothetical protein